MGQATRLVWILGDQQLERGVGMTEPAGGIQPRREPEADGGGVDGCRIDSSDLHQLAQPRLLSARQRPQAGDRQASILVDEGNDVCDRGDGNKIQMAEQRFRVRAEQRLPELEDDACPAELAERIPAAAVRPHERAFR